MNQLESLISKHAKYSDLKSELKSKVCDEYSKHKDSDFKEIFTGDDKLDELDEALSICPTLAYRAVKILNRDAQWPECYSYDEVLHMYGCEHCIKARSLKKELATVNQKLGQIRGAITRAGRKLNNSISKV